jgi:DNA primase
MSGRIPQSFIDDLIARTDIVELIGGRVALKKAGREFKACCPFHSEKTPSFWVSPDKQFYHCFGCQAHGTALGFLMQFDQLSFPEAIEELASRLGLSVPHEGAARTVAGAAAPSATEDPAPSYTLLARAADFYTAALRATPRAQRYAHDRGLEAATLEAFQIGYAPDAWDGLLRQLGGGTDERRALAELGLIIERNGGEGWYDRFRDRLMFPIRDTRGRVIAFGGRLLDQGEPKYLNSPESALFHKGRELYGLFEVRRARGGSKRLLLVEGYMDAVRLHQAGIDYAVATLGTATTPEHLRRAFRLVSELVFCFDGDRAGRAAAWRALQNVLPQMRAGQDVRFLFLPEGEDPDSLVGREGRADFEARLPGSLPLSEYLVAHLRAEADPRHADGKARFVALARPLLDALPAGVYRDLLLDHLAAAIGVTSARMQQWLGSAPDTAVKTPAPAACAPERFGRGSLLTQAIALLLHFPAAAAAVGAGQRAALARLAQPGVEVLGELLQEQELRPARSMAQILERWRERPQYRRLSELAASEPLVADERAAAAELTEAVTRLLDAGLRGSRLEALIETARARPLDEDEKSELQALTGDLHRGRPPRAP